MKRTWTIFLLVNLILSACMSTYAPTPTIAPSATTLPTATPAPTSTAISTATPTPIPNIQVGDLFVPDPRATNPELFDLQKPEAPIPQFINAMKMAGIEVSAEQIAQGITFVSTKEDGTPLKVDEKPVVLGIYRISKNNMYYALIFTFTEEKGWHPYLTTLAQANNIRLGNMINPESESFYKMFNLGVAVASLDLLPSSLKPIDYTYALSQIDFLRQRDPESQIRFQAIIDAIGMYDWFAGKNYSSEQMKEYLINLVQQTMRDIEGEVDYVVVVNEPYIEIDRPNDPFWEKLGYDYIDIAFQAAREVNPEIELIYNDSMNQSLADPDENGYTTSLTRRVTSRLKEKGLVDAVGMQMHIRAGNPPTKDDIIATMRSYEIPVHVTECDVDLSDIRGSQEDRLTLQAKIYRDIIAACIESGVCKSITFWGNGDDTSWLEVNSGRRNADPTLFISLPNGESAPKSAYYAIADLLLQSILNKK